MEEQSSRSHWEELYYKLCTAEQKCATQEDELLALRHQLNLLQEDQASAAYTVVLIDGNNFLAAGNLVRFGDDGGRNLANFIADYAAKEGARDLFNKQSFKVVARIYADVQGLASCYQRAGAVPSAEVFRNFVYGFNHFGVHADIIDIGPISRMADERIRNQLLHYLNDKTCCEIILGCRMDSSVIPLLQENRLNSWVTSRVKLLVGAPQDQHTALSHLRRAHLPAVFVTGVQYLEKQYVGPNHERATCEVTNNQHTNAARENCSSAQNRELCSSVSLVSVEKTPDTLLSLNDACAVPRSHGSPTRSSGTSTSNRIEENTAADSAWSRVASRAAKLPFKDLAKISPPVKTNGKVILLNAEGRRLDVAMSYDAQKVAEMKKFKYCNQHYIGKGCCHYICGNDNCPHRHDVNLSKEDKKWLRLVARETVCKKGTSCRDADCIYGHHCPYPKSGSGSVCVNGDSCRFRAMHGMDLVVATRIPAGNMPRKER